MKLFFEPLNLYRTENDQNAINNLVRKGWVIIQEPEIPPSPPSPLTEEEIKWNTYSEAVNEGFLVSPENFKLKLGDEDRSMFGQMLSLVKEALDLGIISNDSVQKIKDSEGQLISLTTLRFRQIMVDYGFYYKNLWDQLNSQSLSS